MKKNIFMVSLCAFALSTPAFAVDTETSESSTKVQQDSNGNYSNKTSSQSTDAAGTTYTKDQKKTVDVDSSGNKDINSTTVETKDPKGLMNKTTVKKMHHSKTNSDGTVDTSNKTVVDGKTVESNTETTKP